jgi:hypothetical protein
VYELKSSAPTLVTGGFLFSKVSLETAHPERVLRLTAADELWKAHVPDGFFTRDARTYGVKWGQRPVQYVSAHELPWSGNRCMEALRHLCHRRLASEWTVATACGYVWGAKVDADVSRAIGGDTQCRELQRIRRGKLSGSMIRFLSGGSSTREDTAWLKALDRSMKKSLGQGTSSAYGPRVAQEAHIQGPAVNNVVYSDRLVPRDKDATAERAGMVVAFRRRRDVLNITKVQIGGGSNLVTHLPRMTLCKMLTKDSEQRERVLVLYRVLSEDLFDDRCFAINTTGNNTLDVSSATLMNVSNSRDRKASGEHLLLGEEGDGQGGDDDGGIGRTHLLPDDILTLRIQTTQNGVTQNTVEISVYNADMLVHQPLSFHDTANTMVTFPLSGERLPSYVYDDGRRRAQGYLRKVKGSISLVQGAGGKKRATPISPDRHRFLTPIPSCPQRQHGTLFPSNESAFYSAAHDITTRTKRISHLLEFAQPGLCLLVSVTTKVEGRHRHAALCVQERTEGRSILCTHCFLTPQLIPTNGPELRIAYELGPNPDAPYPGISITSAEGGALGQQEVTKLWILVSGASRHRSKATYRVSPKTRLTHLSCTAPQDGVSVENYPDLQFIRSLSGSQQSELAQEGVYHYNSD